MDCKYLVDSGKYSRDDLNDSQNAFIDGLEQSIENSKELLGMIRDDYCEDESMLTKIKMEEMEEFVKEFEDYMDGVICNYIVVFSDHNFAEEESRKSQEASQPSRQQSEQGSRYETEQSQPKQQSRSGGRYR